MEDIPAALLIFGLWVIMELDLMNKMPTMLLSVLVLVVSYNPTNTNELDELLMARKVDYLFCRHIVAAQKSNRLPPMERLEGGAFDRYCPAITMKE